MSTQVMAGAAGLAAFVVAVVLLYNRFVRRRYAVRSAWADVEAYLRKRHDLVPALVEVVRGCAAHEAATFARVSELRSAAMRAAGPGETSRAETRLAAVLDAVVAVAEAYPTLRASAHFQTLMIDLREIEDGIEYARRAYNAAVLAFNVAIGVFPANVVAAAFAFHPAVFFELDDAPDARDPAAVAFP